MAAKHLGQSERRSQDQEHERQVSAGSRTRPSRPRAGGRRHRGARARALPEDKRLSPGIGRAVRCIAKMSERPGPNRPPSPGATPSSAGPTIRSRRRDDLGACPECRPRQHQRRAPPSRHPVPAAVARWSASASCRFRNHCRGDTTLVQHGRHEHLLAGDHHRERIDRCRSQQRRLRTPHAPEWTPNVCNPKPVDDDGPCGASSWGDRSLLTGRLNGA